MEFNSPGVTWAQGHLKGKITRRIYCLNSTVRTGSTLAEKLQFKRLPIAPEPKDLLAAAFGRASKSASALRVVGGPLEGARRRERERIVVASRIIRDKLSKVVKDTPSLPDLPPFYRELVDALVDIDRMRKSLGAINGVIKVIDKLEREHLRRLGSAESPAEASKIRKQAYGRISSIIKRASPHLEFLREAARKLADLPSVYVDMPTIVIAGYPNVGKTTLLRQLTGSEPEIASYPFTTKGLQLGYFDRGHRRYQVIDTPGLLDRPLAKRNPIERQAIAALNHLADAIIFLFDPTQTCGFEFESQLRLYHEIRKLFPKIPVLPAANKSDLIDEAKRQRVLGSCPDVLFISASSGEGVGALLEKALKTLGSSES